MNVSTTRIPLAIALSSALAFAVGCSNQSADDRTAMEPVQETPAEPIPPVDTATQDESVYAADAGTQDGVIGDGQRSDQPVDDTWITTKVKSSLLADSNVSGLDINVDTLNGVVTLSGQVDDQAQIDHATRIARDIQGVTEVRTAELVTKANP